MRNTQLQLDLQKQSFHIRKFNDFTSLEVVLTIWQEIVNTIPEKTKLLLTYIEDYGGRGYEVKKHSGEISDGVNEYDKKDNFHYLPMDQSRLNFLLKDVPKIQKTKIIEFIYFLHKLHVSIIDFMEEIRPELQELVVIDDCDLKKEFQQSWYQWIIRTLFYHPGQPISEKIAAGHFDLGFITKNFFSTATGLRYTDVQTGEIREMEIPKGYVIIQIGMQGDYVFGLKALHHEVINSEVTQKNGRAAIVAFSDLATQPVYHKYTNGPTRHINPIEYYSWDRETFLNNIKFK